MQAVQGSVQGVSGDEVIALEDTMIQHPWWLGPAMMVVGFGGSALLRFRRRSRCTHRSIGRAPGGRSICFDCGKTNIPWDWK